MVNGGIKRGPVFDYSLAFLYTLLIFFTIPYVRPFQEFVRDQYGKNFFGYAVLGGVVLCLIGTILYLIKRADRCVSASNCLWLAGVAGLYIYFTLKLWKCPVDAIHFLEYGFLSFLSYRALRHHIRDVTIFFTASFIVLFIGTIDEIIQWIIPNRVGTFRDIRINFLGGALFQVGVWKGVKPGVISEKIRSGSVKILSGVVAGCLVLLGLCALMTPPRIAYVAEKTAPLSHLQDGHHMMSEYGHRHRDWEAGTFYSRFTKEELRTIDSERQRSYARILDEHLHGPYGDFLKAYTPLTAPFLYEMRIHLFRRDQYELRGNKEKEPEKGAKYYTVAYQENLILENYFGKTLSRTGYRWPDGKKARIEDLADPDRSYESPVSADLFTLFSERELWVAIGLAVCLLLGINVYISRSRREEK